MPRTLDLGLTQSVTADAQVDGEHRRSRQSRA
jgi:hypothetical protein